MQYSRAMIDLIMEIRRRIDSEMKPSIKLANPEVLRELAEYFPTAKDTILKTLIKELLTLAGDDWRALLYPPAPELPKQSVKVYRGQTMLVDKPMEAESDEKMTGLQSTLIIKEVPPAKPQRMYRGRPVE